MKRKWTSLRYDEDTDSWLVFKGINGYMMHCGEWFELNIGGNEGIFCRLELGSRWYIVMGSEGVKLNLRKDQVYKVNIDV